MRALLVGLLLAAGACHESAESDTDAACTILCRCESPLAGIQQQCIATCENGGETTTPGADAGVVFTEDGGVVFPVDAGTGKVDVITLPDGCAECVFEHEATCSTLIASCNSVCSQHVVVDQP